MKRLDLIQGSPEWLAHRARSFNASDVSAAMGISSYRTRSQLLHQLATGVAPEIDEITQKRFDDGHKFEAIAREWAEEILIEELTPEVLAADPGDFGGLPLSASFDGLTKDWETSFEHKSLNQELRESLPKGEIPEEYHPQMEQGLMLSGAKRCLFMASSGARDDMLYAWYESRPEVRQWVLDTWAQIQRDLEAYDPPEAEAPKPVGKTPDNLPALQIQVTGMVTHSNLNQFREHALAVIDGINTDLQTDEDFATAEATVKWLKKDVEDRLAAAKDQALQQTADIYDVLKTLDQVAEQARQQRLRLDKLVKDRKEAVRVEIAASARANWLEAVEQINAGLGGKVRLPEISIDIGGAMKGKRTVATLRDAADTEVARAKIEAHQLADRMRANLEILRAEAKGYETLFSDAQSLVQKDADDLRAQISLRIGEHKRAEEARIEAERARIREEEQRKAQADAEAKAAEERRQREAAEQQASEDEANRARRKAVDDLQTQEAAKSPESAAPTPSPEELRESARRARERAAYAERNEYRLRDLAEADAIEKRADEIEAAQRPERHLMVELGDWQKAHGISAEAMDALIGILRNRTPLLDMAA